jgi:hypothetical protein
MIPDKKANWGLMDAVLEVVERQSSRNQTFRFYWGVYRTNMSTNIMTTVMQRVEIENAMALLDVSRSDVVLELPLTPRPDVLVVSAAALLFPVKLPRHCQEE